MDTQHTRSLEINCLLLLLAGSGMQGYANGTIDAFLMAFLFLLAGVAVVSRAFPGGKPEMRAFFLTFALCMFVGGLAQCYALAVFNEPQSMIDAHTFFEQISPQPPFTAMADLPFFNAPLAVVIWQQVYKLTWVLGLKFGPYAGVMFNALMMGLTGSLTVRTGRELLGDDSWRLQRVGTLFAFCGLFILAGSILLRDCFTTFFNALVLWGIVRWLVRPTPRNLLYAAALTGVAAYAMVYLRPEAVLLFGLYGGLALLFWFFAKGPGTARRVAATIALCVLLAAWPYFVDYYELAQNIQASGRESYGQLLALTSSEESLGMRLVVDQPLPIRLVLGSGILMVSPIPLWAYFQIGSPEYDWLKGYNGIYQVLLLPLVFAGCLAVYRLVRKDRKQAVPLLFLAIYLLINVAAVAATSLEQRHFAQFMPALLILAVLPDTREKGTQNEVYLIALRWFAVVIFVHLAWAIMKG